MYILENRTPTLSLGGISYLTEKSVKGREKKKEQVERYGDIRVLKRVK
jgi:hypothetical protein